MLVAQSSRTSNSIFLQKSLDQPSLQILREMSRKASVRNTAASLEY